ncbi:MAG: phytase, partial [Alphaproteobacteria bacterium]|nr:phytase [Alphaproteobacteria bacterium]
MYVRPRSSAVTVSAALLSGLMLVGCATGVVAPAPAMVRPFAETPPVGTAGGEDAADDPAIWLNPADPAGSLVFGTDKKAGFYAYDLSGRQVQGSAVGLLNNADIRSQVMIEGTRVDLMGASNRSDSTLALFTIDASTGIATTKSFTPTGKIEPYGFCMGDDAAGWLAAIPYKDGEVQVYRLSPDGAPSLAATWKFTEVMEGCVIDEENAAIFISEENTGLWRIEYEGETERSRTLIDRVKSGSGLVADVEGVALWRGADGGGYVVASSQTADRYLVYDRKAPNALRGSFRIAPSTDGSIDGVSHTDGIEIASAPLGPTLPRGIFVAQDDANTLPAQAQNFKFVDWREIETA